MSNPNFIVLRSPFNLLCISKDGTHRGKTEFKLGPSSDVNLTSDTDKQHPTILYKRTLRSLRSFTFFIKECGVLCVLLRSL